MLNEGDERAKALLLLAVLDMQQSKPMRVNMKEPEELDPMRKIDEIRRFSNKELRLTKESMGTLPRSSEYCGPIKKKSYSYLSGIIGIAYNPFLSEDIRDCFFDYEQAVLLRFWTSRIVTIKCAANPQIRLGRHNVGSGRSGPTAIGISGYRGTKTDGHEPNYNRVCWHQ